MLKKEADQRLAVNSSPSQPVMQPEPMPRAYAYAYAYAYDFLVFLLAVLSKASSGGSSGD
jgi:hypothetical protein